MAGGKFCPETSNSDLSFFTLSCHRWRFLALCFEDGGIRNLENELLGKVRETASLSNTRNLEKFCRSWNHVFCDETHPPQLNLNPADVLEGKNVSVSVVTLSGPLTWFADVDFYVWQWDWAGSEFQAEPKFPCHFRNTSWSDLSENSGLSVRPARLVWVSDFVWICVVDVAEPRATTPWGVFVDVSAIECPPPHISVDFQGRGCLVVRGGGVIHFCQEMFWPEFLSALQQDRTWH